MSQPLSSIKLALLAQQMRSENADRDYVRAEPIAVVGIELPFPWRRELARVILEDVSEWRRRDL